MTQVKKRSIDVLQIVIGALIAIAGVIVYDVFTDDPIVGYMPLDHTSVASGYTYNNTQHDDVQLRLFSVDSAQQHSYVLACLGIVQDLAEHFQ